MLCLPVGWSLQSRPKQYSEFVSSWGGRGSCRAADGRFSCNPRLGRSLALPVRQYFATSQYYYADFFSSVVGRYQIAIGSMRIAVSANTPLVGQEIARSD